MDYNIEMIVLLVASVAAVAFGSGLWIAAKKPYTMRPAKYTVPYQWVYQPNGEYRENMYDTVADNILHPDFMYHMQNKPMVNDLGEYGLPRHNTKINHSMPVTQMYRRSNIYL